MKKLSLVKILAALLIVNCYLFTCGVMGTVGGAEIVQQPMEAPDGVPSDDPGADGQGTLDFLVPDETNNGFVELNLLNIAPTSLSDKAVQSTYSERHEEFTNLSDPEEDNEEILGADDDGDEDESEDPDEIIIHVPEPDYPDEPDETPAQSSTPASTTTEPEIVTTPAVTTTTPPPTSSATHAGIPVDVDDTSATSSDDQPDEIEPDNEPDSGDNTAAGEILYVRSNGGVVSGTALEIVSKITQNEVGYTFAPEAIKAQAVAAYTYVKFCNEYGTYPSVGLASSVSDSVEVLVRSVIGKAVYYNGAIIQAVYSASSAGYTASSKNVWGTDYPYLESRFCDLDAKYDPNYGRTVQFSSDDIKSRVYSVTGIELSGDPADWIVIEERVDGKYVGQMSIGGYHSFTDNEGDTLKITGRRFRERIMSFDLRSSAFDVAYDSTTDMFTFTTYGYGHGVGLSQNGANALATYLGYDYKQILTYYYTGTEVM